MQRKLRDAETLIVDFVPATPNPGDVALGALTGVRNAWISAPYQKQVGNILGTPIANLASLCNAAGITGVANIDQFASYYNTGLGGNWQTLLPPDWVNVYNNQFTVNPNPLNVYAPPDVSSPGRGVWNGSSFAPGTGPNLGLYAGWTFIFGICTVQFTAPSASSSSSSSASGSVASWPNILLSVNGQTANGTMNAPTPFTGTFNSHELIYQGAYGANIVPGQVIAFAFPNTADIVQAVTGVQINGYIGTPGQMYFLGMSPTAAPAGAPGGLVGTSVPTGTTRTSPPT
jgi:hypothetical protein